MSRPKLVVALAAGFALTAGLRVFDVPAADAQSAEPKFEVSTVKIRKSGTPLHIDDCSGDRFLFAGPAFADLLRWAFASHEFADPVPVSLGQTYYDIEAKAAGPIQSEDQCRRMVQALLADRFKLKFHWAEQKAVVFDLLVAGGGPKMQKALPTDAGTDVSIVVDGKMAGGVQWAFAADPELRGRKGLTMAQLAQYLPLPEPAPITDKTALEGRYKIDLRFSMALSAAMADSSVDPPLDAALAKLGLRLEKHNGTVKVPILDHIEAPDEN